ncbi:MAG: aspartate kinase [Muribaculaceae bacterium]|nr:aspartate kinase [Muribaculaceae bacterium]
MKVLKFGGTSVGNAARIKHVGGLISERKGNLVVLSAMSGVTNTLTEISDYLYKNNIPGAQDTLNALEMKYQGVVAELYDDAKWADEALSVIGNSVGYIRALIQGDFAVAEEKEILAQGELVSTALLLNHLKERGLNAVMLPALEFMRTDHNGEPDMKYISTRLLRMLDMTEEADVYITQGYICRNAYGEVDNLKRGGSDYTASLIGAVLESEEIQIWTDIDGMHNNDPRYVEGTRPVGELNFEEAAELAYFGAKILHPNCVLPAKLNNIPVRLLNTLEPSAPGTVIYNLPPDGDIKAVAAKDGITAINIKSGRRLVAYGFMHKVFETFENHKTGIDILATSEVGITVAIDNDTRLADIVDDLKMFGTVSVDQDMVIISVVGDLHWHHAGLAVRALHALEDIPVRLVSYGGSNYNISVVIPKDFKVQALRKLSEHLFNSNPQ